MKSILIPQKSTDDTPTQNVTKEDLRKYKKEKEDKKKAEARKVDNEKYFQKFIY